MCFFIGLASFWLYRKAEKLDSESDGVHVCIYLYVIGIIYTCHEFLAATAALLYLREPRADHLHDRHATRRRRHRHRHHHHHQSVLHSNSSSSKRPGDLGPPSVSVVPGFVKESHIRTGVPISLVIGKSLDIYLNFEFFFFFFQKN